MIPRKRSLKDKIRDLTAGVAITPVVSQVGAITKKVKKQKVTK